MDGTERDSGEAQRGQVRDPERDGRLKQNRERGISKQAETKRDRAAGGQGRVKDPEKDQRLKQNRRQGET